MLKSCSFVCSSCIGKFLPYQLVKFILLLAINCEFIDDTCARLNCTHFKEREREAEVEDEV
jgi:hypothetical protein